MSTLMNLVNARELISEATSWGKHSIARSNEKGGGVSVGAKHPDADCWCALGALVNVCDSEIEIEEARLALGAFVPHGNVVFYNDAPERTHADIMALYDKAIEAWAGTV